MDHPLIPNGTAQLVENSADLTLLIESLRQAGSFAYDSEFIGEQSYLPKLCLVQVGIPGGVSLIDPLAGVDLTPFWELVCDASIEKIVHAGEQDVEPAFRAVGRPPANVFDVQIAAGFVGLPYPLSLSKLMHELVGVRIGKGLTFTNWDARPLSGQQLKYAADDVRYLPAARAELHNRLTDAGHLDWAIEESAERCKPGMHVFDPDGQYLKIRGASALEPRQLAVLRELTIWRDGAARAADVPPRTLLRDECLLALAKSPATHVEKLKRIRGLPRPVEAEHGETIVAATQKALSLATAHLPPRHYTEPRPREKFDADALWAAAQSMCYEQGIDPGLVGSRQEIVDLRRRTDDSSARLLRGWRRTALGEKLLARLGRRST
ncbi:MAG TPA: HRDC domain-containing protein [Tepidisphaeraceae bacterium]|nr:HRDC domain-containing protein [Tepidisphaeraceae bacterium]